MEIVFEKDEGIINFKPNKINKGGHDLEISLCKDFVCFSIVDGGNATNVQVDYNEFQQLIHYLRNVRIKQSFVEDEPIHVTTEKHLPLKKPCKHNVKMSYLEKWITKGDFEFFTLNQFYRVYPKQKYNKNLTFIISDLISRKIISEPTKDKFKVNRRVD